MENIRTPATAVVVTFAVIPRVAPVIGSFGLIGSVRVKGVEIIIGKRREIIIFVIVVIIIFVIVVIIIVMIFLMFFNDIFSWRRSWFFGRSFGFFLIGRRRFFLVMIFLRFFLFFFGTERAAQLYRVPHPHAERL